MKDEPHSHKKATAALVAILLLAYVGSYLWMRQGKSVEIIKGFRCLVTADKEELYPNAGVLDRFYWPLRKLDVQLTGKSISFGSDWVEAYKF